MLDTVLKAAEDPASHQFIRYWFQIRGDRMIPDRRDIDPAALVPLLPKVWLWDFVPERDDFACRLAGEEITAVFGRSPRGTFLGDWMSPAIIDVARARYRRVIDQPAICIASGNSFVERDKHAWCERIITPMTNGGDKPAVVFGMSVWRMDRLALAKIEREETDAVFFPMPRLARADAGGSAASAAEDARADTSRS